MKARGEGMKVVRISANNVKVAFSEAELLKYGLDISVSEGECCVSRGTVKKILEAIKSESGVDYCGERVFIRLIRERDGSCDMIISRLGLREKGREEASVLRFLSVGALIAACRTMDKSIRADAYVGSGGTYLIVSGDDEQKAAGYGERLEFALAEAFVREHCRLIAAENAVEVLGRL